MIADLEPYPEYKESGVEWLGDLPEHWGVRRLKGVVDPARPITYGIVQCGEHIPEGIPYIRPIDMREDGSVSQDKLKRTSRTIAASYRRSEVRGGDVVVSIGPSFGKVMVVPGGLTGANLTQGTARIAPGQATSAEFFLWLFRSQAMLHSMAAVATGSTFMALNLEPLGRIRVPLPPLDEQAAIVRFLGWANGRLERAIRAKRKVIALLNEQKQVIIHRAVTRGLDPSVPLKPSGVPWLGDIPQHWGLSPNRAFLRIRKVLVGDRHPQYQLLSLTKRGVIVRDLSEMRGKFSADMGSSQEVRSGDLVFCLFDVPETPRTVGLSQHNGMITGAYTVMECSDLEIAKFLGLFYIAMDDRKLLSPIYSGLRNTIPKDRFLGAKTPIPPATERTSILAAVEKDSAALNLSISRLEREIELLREYRTRLVADVVTGKLDVREAAALLPNEAPRDTVEGDTNLGDETEAADEESAV